jgi:hypothetical protein
VRVSIELSAEEVNEEVEKWKAGREEVLSPTLGLPARGPRLHRRVSSQNLNDGPPPNVNVKRGGPGHLLLKAGLLCRSASRAAAVATLPMRKSRRNSARNR